MRAVKKFRICPRCRGVGIFDAHLHVWKGRCFSCNGSGKIKTKQYQEFCNAITFMDNIDEYIRKLDAELEWKNSRIENRISRGIRVNSGIWYEIDQIERQIEEYRKCYAIYQKVIKESDNIVFVE